MPTERLVERRLKLAAHIVAAWGGDVSLTIARTESDFYRAARKLAAFRPANCPRAAALPPCFGPSRSTNRTRTARVPMGYAERPPFEGGERRRAQEFSPHAQAHDLDARADLQLGTTCRKARTNGAEHCGPAGCRGRHRTEDGVNATVPTPAVHGPAAETAATRGAFIGCGGAPYRTTRALALMASV